MPPVSSPISFSGYPLTADDRSSSGPGAPTADHNPPDPMLEEVRLAFATLPARPPEPFLSVEMKWRFGVGDPSEGPNPAFSARPQLGDTIRTPHLVLLPDTPLWYECVFDADAASILRIIGDDGVQPFINGVRVRTLGRNLFPAGLGSGQILTIRVVNNAQHGGLLSFERAPLADWETWEHSQARRTRLEHLVRKLTALDRSSRPDVHHAEKAVLDALRDPTERNLTAAEESLAPGPLILVGPILHSLDPNKITIRWETDTAGEAMLDWSATGRDEWQHTQTAKSSDGLFEAMICGVTPGQRIFYRARQNQTVGESASFIAPATAGAGFQFTIWGDCQTGRQTLGRLLELMRSEPPDFTIGVGDLVGTGCMAEQWRDFFATIQPFAAKWPFFLMPGNHDYDGYYDDFVPELFRRYARSEGQPNYIAWTWHNARFVAIDPNETFPISIREESPQHAWLLAETDSAEWRAADWRIILVHQPCFSQGKPDGYEGDLRIRELIGPLTQTAGVDFVISGHTHDYERLKVTHRDGSFTHHLIVGGGGAELTPAHAEVPRIVMDRLLRVHHFGRFRISGRTAEFEVIDRDGRRRDHFVVTKPGPSNSYAP